MASNGPAQQYRSLTAGIQPQSKYWVTSEIVAGALCHAQGKPAPRDEICCLVRIACFESFIEMHEPSGRYPV